MFWVRLSNQPEACGVPGSRSDTLARVCPDWAALGLRQVVCLTGLIVTPHDVPGGRGPRRVAPVRGAGRQPSTLSPARSGTRSRSVAELACDLPDLVCRLAGCLGPPSVLAGFRLVTGRQFLMNLGKFF